MISWIESEAQARELAEALLRPGRRRPAVVVSVPGARTSPYVDVQELDKAVGTDCEIYVIPTGDLTFAFAERLPPGRQVYGGASRVYAVDNAWVADQYASPLRFAFGPDEDGRVLNALIEDAMTAAHAAGRGPGRRGPVSGARLRVVGSVQGMVAGRVLVDVERVFPAVLFPDRLVPGLGGPRLFRERQQVAGVLDPDTNVLEVDAPRPPQEALAAVKQETVLLAKVDRVASGRVDLLVHPFLALSVDRTEGEEDLRTVYTPGEVLPVEITGLDRDGLPQEVQVLPASFAELAEPVALLADGPPWLLVDDVEEPGPAEEPPERDTSGQAQESVAEPDELGQEITGLRHEVRKLQTQVERLETELRQARSRTRAAQQRATQLDKDLRAASEHRAVASPGLFDDAHAQFLHEVYVSWAERTTAADKETFPWRPPALGPAFLASLDQVQGVDRAKVVEVAADVACGRADTMPARGVHQLRTGPGGDDPPVTRQGGQTCWRAYLQQNSPSARRLHYWRLPGGDVELSSVRVHDDFTP